MTRNRLIALLLFVGLFASYVAVERGEFVSTDGMIVAGVGRTLYEDQRLEKFGNSFGADPAPESTPKYATYGIGMSLLVAPLWYPQLRANQYGDLWLTMANAALLALGAVLLFFVGLELRWRRSVAFLVAAGFGTLTMVPSYSTDLFSEPAITTATLGVLLGLLRWRAGHRFAPLAVGCSIATSFLFRTDAVLLVGLSVVAIPLFVRWPALRDTLRSWTPQLVVPIAAALAWVLYYNNLRFGSPFQYGYERSTFKTPILHGLFVQLVSPGKGFFWYNPLLFFGVVALPLLWRKQPTLTATIVALATVRVLFYATWSYPEGSVALGPRFLLPWCGLLAIPLGEGIHWLSATPIAWRRVAYSVLGTTAVVAAVLTVSSLWVGYEHYQTEITVYSAATYPPDQAAALVEQDWHRSYYTFSKSPVVRQLRAMNDVDPVAMRWFRGGLAPQGALALLTAAACFLAGAVLSRERRIHVDLTRDDGDHDAEITLANNVS
jgi:hypothetical protein